MSSVGAAGSFVVRAAACLPNHCAYLDLCHRHHHLPSRAPASTSTRPTRRFDAQFSPSIDFYHPPNSCANNSFGCPARWLRDTTELFQVSIKPTSCVDLFVLHADPTALLVFRSAHPPRPKQPCVQPYSHTTALMDTSSRSSMLEKPSREVRTTAALEHNLQCHEADSLEQEPARLV